MKIEHCRPGRLAGPKRIAPCKVSLESQSNDRVLAQTGSTNVLLEHCEGLRPKPISLFKRSAAEAWADSGAMWLSGAPAGPPLVCPAPLASAAEAAMALLRSLALDSDRLTTIDGATLLGDKAAYANLSRRGSISPGGTCRFLETATGTIAVNLARECDRRSVSAWLEADVDGEDWSAIERTVKTRSSQSLVERAAWVEIPAASVTSPKRNDRAPVPWNITRPFGNPSPRSVPCPLIVDLSSLWAGPLAGSLLSLAGANVIKVESVMRPDGARFGNHDFFDLLNHGKRFVALDFQSRDDINLLARLISKADIVIDSSRPRATDQLGLKASEMIRLNPRLTWVSITGYPISGPDSNRVSFGDDAAVAGGLYERFAEDPIFFGDAIGDPLAGVHAALIALVALRSGGGQWINVAMSELIRWIATREQKPERTRVFQGGDKTTTIHSDNWRVATANGERPVRAPIKRLAESPAREAGADNERVFRELEI